MIITIGRQFSSGGSEIGRKLSEKLGIPYYDKNILKYAAEANGLSEEYVKSIEEKPSATFLYSMAMVPYAEFGGLPNMFSVNMAVNTDQSDYIRKKAEEGPCIFVGRCADSVLEKRDDVLNVFIYSSMENRVARAKERYGLTEKEAVRSIQQTDKKRASYYNMNSGDKKWGVKESYHMMLDSGTLGIDGVVDIIAAAYECLSK